MTSLEWYRARTRAFNAWCEAQAELTTEELLEVTQRTGPKAAPHGDLRGTLKRGGAALEGGEEIPW